jgi:hypothetical protein
MRIISEDSLFTIVLFACTYCESKDLWPRLSEIVDLVPNDGHCETAVVVWVRLQVQVLDMRRVEERVDVRAGEGVDLSKRPPIVAHPR